MIIKAIKAENYTVFENTTIQFSKGINVFIGENATGKTHMLKLLYSASSSCVMPARCLYFLIFGPR